MVGAFERFDCDGVFVSHADGLTDAEAQEFEQQWVREHGVRDLQRVGCGARHEPYGREMLRDVAR